MKNSYLNHMGITTWYLRDNAHIPHFFKVELRNSSQKVVGYLLADFDYAVSQQDSENLLQKIADALTSHSQREIISFCNFNENTDLFFILFGDKAKKIPCVGRVIQSFSLAHLIENADYKKQLWQEIKPLRDLLL